MVSFTTPRIVSLDWAWEAKVMKARRRHEMSNFIFFQVYVNNNNFFD
ncbi:hypothetical protein ADICYQ_4766 [Cyclobacterium qasimii M12-11B]|uniref:Uncharacterized protein n=1 Tax=Cyclobacterium qasimii M12-11B TaxID=641524 RepID=S7WPJ9_9BACT|nr:hypothetical protein ADICYQ_4766 [Cyclobacterium qasimii M12-11B]